MRNTYLQLIHMVTGVFIAILLGIHMVIMHLDAILGFFGVQITHVTSWDSMMGRARQGLWVGIYIPLLALALYHGLNGLRNVLIEVIPSATGKRVMTWILIIVGIVFLVLGIYAPVVLLSA